MRTWVFWLGTSILNGWSVALKFLLTSLAWAVSCPENSLSCIWVFHLPVRKPCELTSNLRNSLCMTCVWLVVCWVVWFFCLFCFVFNNLEGQMVANNCHIPQLSTLTFQLFDGFPPKPRALSPYNSDRAGISSQMRSRKVVWNCRSMVLRFLQFIL